MAVMCQLQGLRTEEWKGKRGGEGRAQKWEGREGGGRGGKAIEAPLNP